MNETDKTTLLLPGLLALAAALPLPAQAVDLLGQTLTFERLYPNVGTEYGVPFAPKTVTVVAGDGDEASWAAPGRPYLTVSPEATTLTFTWVAGSAMVGAGPTFDGYGISGFSFAPSGFAVTGNTTGMATELTYTADTLYLDLNGSHPPGQIVLTLAQPIPEPATWALLAGGLALVGAQARRRRTHR